MLTSFKNKKLFKAIIIAITVIILLFVFISINSIDDSHQDEISYQEYESLNKDKYLSFKENILNELKSRMNLVDTKGWQNDYNSHLQMTSSQFEGPQVHIEKLVYRNKEFYRDSVNKNREEFKEFITPFTIHGFQFDPDNRTTGKPDIIVSVAPPVPFQENRSRILNNILEKIDGRKDNITPYKTYSKEVYSIVDSTIQIEHIKMDLWLTKFEVNISIQSWGIKKEENDDGNREIANQRHPPFDLLLRIIPNVSPWYVNDGSSFDKKADMAIGAIYCNEIIKDPKDSRNIGVVPRNVGDALPLIKQTYYNNLNNPQEIFNQKDDNNTIWNKPLYAYISVPSIGSYRTLSKKGDEMVNFSFIMPLLVRGSWDIQIPSSIVPEYQPTPPYKRKLTNILLPKWGLGVFGQGLSLIIISGFLVVLVYKLI